MIDIRAEITFPLTEAPKREELPRRRDKKPSVATFYCWANKGVRGVRLETIRIGGTLCTSVEALQRFFNALSQTDHPQPTKPATTGAITSPAAAAAPQSSKNRQQEQQRVKRALDEAGF